MFYAIGVKTVFEKKKVKGVKDNGYFLFAKFCHVKNLNSELSLTPPVGVVTVDVCSINGLSYASARVCFCKSQSHKSTKAPASGKQQRCLWRICHIRHDCGFLFCLRHILFCLSFMHKSVTRRMDSCYDAMGG